MYTFAQSRKPAQKSTQSSARASANIRPLHVEGERDSSAGPSSTPSTHNFSFSRIPSHSETGPVVQAKLRVNAPGDTYEREADTVADRVMRMPQSEGAEGESKPKGGECSACGDDHEEVIRRKEISSGLPLSDTTAAEVQRLNGRGRPMSRSEREMFEPRFGVNFGNVRLHDGSAEGALAQKLNARAFTLGPNVAFAPGEYRPGTSRGDRLLAHELTHVVQQGGVRQADQAAGGTSTSIQTDSAPPQVQRDPAPAPQNADPLCATYSYTVEKVLIEGYIDDLKAGADVEYRLKLIREIKWVLRCGTDSEKAEVKSLIETGLGAEVGAAVLKEAGTPFGGYRGAYPGYYGGAKGRLERLGVSQVEGFDSFAYDPRSDPSSKFMTGRENTATTEAPVIAGTDILYFYGHQYAQYENPGVFANGEQTQFIDLRALAGKGDLSRVKLIISTSCATCCKEAVEVFSSLFPNAVILGYRKSAPIDGDAVRTDFDKKIQGLKKPLLLEESVDIDAIVEVWKSVIASHHPNENTRLPGYYRNGTVYYLENGAWSSMPATDAANTCRKKGGRIEEAAH